MVGHTPALIASLITCIKAREYTSLPSKWIIGWDMSLQGKKSANSSNTSMQDWKSTFHKQSWNCGAMENQKFMHTNKSQTGSLCAVWKNLRVLNPFVLLPCRQWEQRSRWFALRWLFFLQCQHDRASRISGTKTIYWPSSMCGFIHCPQPLFSPFKDWYKTSMSQVCALWFLPPEFLKNGSTENLTYTLKSSLGGRKSCDVGISSVSHDLGWNSGLT